MLTFACPPLILSHTSHLIMEFHAQLCHRMKWRLVMQDLEVRQFLTSAIAELHTSLDSAAQAYMRNPV
jgi:hypothetical protein